MTITTSSAAFRPEDIGRTLTFGPIKPRWWRFRARVRWHRWRRANPPMIVLAVDARTSVSVRELRWLEPRRILT